MIGWSCNKHIHCKRKYFLLHTKTPLLQYILFRLSYKLFLILETLITRTECFFYKWTEHAMPSRYAAVTMTCNFFFIRFVLVFRGIRERRSFRLCWNLKFWIDFGKRTKRQGNNDFQIFSTESKFTFFWFWRLTFDNNMWWIHNSLSTLLTQCILKEKIFIIKWLE